MGEGARSREKQKNIGDRLPQTIDQTKTRERRHNSKQNYATSFSKKETTWLKGWGGIKRPSPCILESSGSDLCVRRITGDPRDLVVSGASPVLQH